MIEDLRLTHNPNIAYFNISLAMRSGMRMFLLEEIYEIYARRKRFRWCS